MSHPHEGKRIKKTNNIAVYLVLDGVRRHIPDNETFDKLFNAWNVEDWSDADVESIPLGGPLNNAYLSAKGPRSSGEAIYLFDWRSNYLGDRMWRHIVNSDVMRKYDFNFGKVSWNNHELGDRDKVPIGPNITG